MTKEETTKKEHNRMEIKIIRPPTQRFELPGRENEYVEAKALNFWETGEYLTATRAKYNPDGSLEFDINLAFVKMLESTIIGFRFTDDDTQEVFEWKDPKKDSGVNIAVYKRLPYNVGEFFRQSVITLNPQLGPNVNPSSSD
jgi:hypothetical protein